VTVRVAAVLLLAAAVLMVAFPAASAAAEEAARAGASAARDVDWKQHPGAAIAAAFGVAALCLLALVGFGCAVALLGAVFPAVQAAADRRARTLGAGWPFVVGSLLAVGVLLALGAAAGTRSEGLVGLVLLLVVLPAFLLALLGSLAGLPLLGERMLGARGAEASPLRRSIVASVALGLGVLPGVVFPPLAPVSALAVLTACGWPLGLGLATVLRRAEPAPGAAPPPA
jgi:hypothetical protein